MKLRASDWEAIAGFGGIVLTAIGIGSFWGWRGALIAVGLLLFGGALMSNNTPDA